MVEEAVTILPNASKTTLGLLPIPVPAAIAVAQQLVLQVKLFTPTTALAPISADGTVWIVVAPSEAKNEPGTLEEAAITCQSAEPAEVPVRVNCACVFWLTAVPRASCSPVSRDWAVDFTWLFCTQVDRLGMPTASTIATIASVTMISIMVMPRCMKSRFFITC